MKSITIVLMCTFTLFIHTSQAAEHYPVVVPESVYGIDHFIGIGYGGTGILGSAGVTALGFIGELQGISLTANHVPLAGEWLLLDVRLVGLNTFEPLTNYSRGSEAESKTFRPNLKLRSAEIGLQVRPVDWLSLSVVPGNHLISFNSFYRTNRDSIHIPSIHITDLDQSYVKGEINVHFDITSREKKRNYLGVMARQIQQQKSAGYSGSTITSYRLDGQYSATQGTAFFLQYFHSDALAIDQSVVGADEVTAALNMDCDSSTTSSQCQKLRSSLINYITGHNEYGTAEPLGGPERMKAYPLNYFRAAHSRYATIEIRFDRFDVIDDHDVFFRLFAEAAQSADITQHLKESSVYSNGFDLGIELDYNFIYKLTVAHGGEGWAAHLSLARAW